MCSNPDVPFSDLEAQHKDFVMERVRKFFDYLETKKYKLHVRVFLSRYRGYTVCRACDGSRLRREARDIFVDDKNIAVLHCDTPSLREGLQSMPRSSCLQRGTTIFTPITST